MPSDKDFFLRISGKGPVYMWKTEIQFCLEKNVSESLPHPLVESCPGFSNEKMPKNLHNDSFRGPRKPPNAVFALFPRLNAPFPKYIHTKSRDQQQKNCRRKLKKYLSHNDNFAFHSFHPLYKYYCWYSYVFLGILSRRQMRAYAREVTVGRLTENVVPCPKRITGTTYTAHPHKSYRFHIDWLQAPIVLSNKSKRSFL